MRALTIAGSDSGGCAGIQADLKTFTALGVFGMSVITSLTAQNTQGVRAIHDLPPEFVAAQIDAVVEDIGVDAFKTGMLSTAEIIEVVADSIRRHEMKNFVLDPVMVSTSGHMLIKPDALDKLRTELVPLALVITPNLHEASELSGIRVEDLQTMRQAAQRIKDLGPDYVLVKGGHLEGEAVDILYDGREFRTLRAQRVKTKNTHGSGCTFAAAITAEIAKGLKVPEAVKNAKRYVTRALRGAASLKIGKGSGPLNHLLLFSANRSPVTVRRT